MSLFRFLRRPPFRRHSPLTVGIGAALITVLAVAGMILPVLRAERDPAAFSASPVSVAGLTLVILIAFLGSAFTAPSRTLRISAVISFYLSLIFVFAGVYFAIVAHGDYGDAVAAYRHYHQLSGSSSGAAASHFRTSRPFNGVERRLWSGIDQLIPGDDSAEALTDTILARRVELSKRPAKECLRLERASAGDVFMDCLHFSVVTMTTVGYGDISPMSRWARIAADVQALTGTALLVFALGLAIGMPPLPKHHRSVFRSRPKR